MMRNAIRTLPRIVSPLPLPAAARLARQSARAGLAFERKATRALSTLFSCETISGHSAAERYATGALRYQRLREQSKPLALIQPNYAYSASALSVLNAKHVGSIDTGSALDLDSIEGSSLSAKRVEPVEEMGLDPIEPIEPISSIDAGIEAREAEAKNVRRCIPDLLLIIPNPAQSVPTLASIGIHSPLIIVCEIKLTWTWEAREKLLAVYCPLTSILFPDFRVLDLVLVKSMTAGAMDAGERAEFSVSRALSQPKPLLQWLGLSNSLLTF